MLPDRYRARSNPVHCFALLADSRRFTRFRAFASKMGIIALHTICLVVLDAHSSYLYRKYFNDSFAPGLFLSLRCVLAAVDFLSVKISKKEIARLLADGKEEKARIKVEQVCCYYQAYKPCRVRYRLLICRPCLTGLDAE